MRGAWNANRECAEHLILHGDVSASAARYVHLDPGQESQNNALMESRILNDTIRENTRDGNLLNIATTYSVFSNSSIIIIILLTSKVN